MHGCEKCNKKKKIGRKNPTVFPGQFNVFPKFCRGSTQLREIRRVKTFSGVGVRNNSPAASFVLYIMVRQNFPLYVTLGIIFSVGCYIYITSRHILIVKQKCEVYFSWAAGDCRILRGSGGDPSSTWAFSCAVELGF